MGRPTNKRTLDRSICATRNVAWIKFASKQVSKIESTVGRLVGGWMAGWLGRDILSLVEFVAA